MQLAAISRGELVSQRRVLVCDGIATAGIELLSQHATVDVQDHLTPTQLRRVIRDYDGLIVRSATQVTAEVITEAINLRVIARAGVGVDNIDVEAATHSGIVVVNAPTAVNVAAAEHTIGLMLALARHIPQADASVRQGRWERSRFIGVEIRGKTLGIIGLGNIGSELARRAKALEMRVMATDPFISDEYGTRMGVTLVPLETLLHQADFITISIPLTPSTRGLLGRRELTTVKPGVRIINCARGEILDEAALLDGLESGHIAGAALDVFAEEPPRNSPLLDNPRVVLTPHLGASTEEAQISAAMDVAAQVVAVLEGRMARYAVNLPSLSPDLAAGLAPYVYLAEKLGYLLSELSEAQLQRLDICYSGELAEYDTTEPIKAAVVKGLLTTASPERINLVNSLIVARNRGLRVVEQKTSVITENCANLISLRAESSRGISQEIAGTTTNGEPRIVRVNQYRVDMALTTSYVLLCLYDDRPGMVGKIGTLLGDYDVNISSMQVARRERGGEAMMILGLDNSLSDSLYQRILREVPVRAARLIRI